MGLSKPSELWQKLWPWQMKLGFTCAFHSEVGILAGISHPWERSIRTQFLSPCLSLAQTRLGFRTRKKLYESLLKHVAWRALKKYLVLACMDCIIFLIVWAWGRSAAALNACWVGACKRHGNDSEPFLWCAVGCPNMPQLALGWLASTSDSQVPLGVPRHQTCMSPCQGEYQPPDLTACSTPEFPKHEVKCPVSHHQSSGNIWPALSF